MKKMNGRKKRHLRVRQRVSGTVQKPRLSVFRSNKHIYAQLVDDEHGMTLVTMTDLRKNGTKRKKTEKTRDSGQKKKVEIAREVGRRLAEKAKKMKIKRVVFDRGGYKFHGRVKALAEGARESELEF